MFGFRRLLLLSSVSAAVLVGAAILAKGETAGLFTDATVVDTAPNQAVLTRYASRTGTVDDFLASQSGSAKLVYDVSGNLVWSPHNIGLGSETPGVSWTASRSTIVVDATASPIGTTTADKVVEDTTVTNTHDIRQSITVIAGETYCFAVRCKAAEHTRISLRAGGTSANSATFDLSNGTIIIAGASSAAAISSLGSGWYLCSVIFVAPTTSEVFYISLCRDTFNTIGLDVYTGDGVSGIYVWGMQVNRGPVPSAYLATTTAARGTMIPSRMRRSA
jgi:hypothetical protein